MAKLRNEHQVSRLPASREATGGPPPSGWALRLKGGALRRFWSKTQGA